MLGIFQQILSQKTKYYDATAAELLLVVVLAVVAVVSVTSHDAVRKHTHIWSLPTSKRDPPSGCHWTEVTWNDARHKNRSMFMYSGICKNDSTNKHQYVCMHVHTHVIHKCKQILLWRNNSQQFITFCLRHKDSQQHSYGQVENVFQVTNSNSNTGAL